MNKFFRKLPLLAKLMLIGLIPFCFLVYLTIQIYNDKAEKLAVFTNYKSYLDESANINLLIDALQEERKYSFDYAMTRSMRQELLLQRPMTDALIQKLLDSGNPALAGFTNYTKLKDLSQVRNRVDTNGVSPNEVMHFYSNTVFRLNTLNTIPPANTPFLHPVYNSLVVQKILSEMITYLGIIRSNIYNVLHTRQYMIETLIGTIGPHDIYNSYEAELQAKASPEVLAQYNNVRNRTAVKPTVDYIDTLFRRFSFDSSLTAKQWWKVSDEGTNSLRAFQNTIWNSLNTEINILYEREKKEQRDSLFFLTIALLAVISAVSYIVFIINRSMGTLRRAAEKIARGETAVQIIPESNDVVGRLARAMSAIDENNHSIAHAAGEIGRGNFDIEVYPRSEQDILANAIIRMKAELQQYSQKMEQLVAVRTEELARSNEDLQQFAHVASHDLKEPLRKIATFSNILVTAEQPGLTEKDRLYLQKIEDAAQRMSTMIEDVLMYSTIAVKQQHYVPVDLNKIMEGVESDLELAILQKNATITYGELPDVNGIPMLLQQLFYNLVNNALKFSKAGVDPIIKISAGSPADLESIAPYASGPIRQFVLITVSDNGIGFNPIYRDRMFGVFFRLNTREKYEGTGLGLALCRKIIQRHKGEIIAEGEEGRGARFHVLIPAGID